jgi:hypothetical protein
MQSQGWYTVSIILRLIYRACETCAKSPRTQRRHQRMTTKDAFWDSQVRERFTLNRARNWSISRVIEGDAEARTRMRGPAGRVEKVGARETSEAAGKESAPRGARGETRGGPCVPPLPRTRSSPTAARVACPISHSFSYRHVHRYCQRGQYTRGRLCICKWFLLQLAVRYLSYVRLPMEDTVHHRWGEEKERGREREREREREGGGRAEGRGVEGEGLSYVSEMHARTRMCVGVYSGKRDPSEERTREETKEREVTSPRGP